MKTLMILGASILQLPAIIMAKNMGLHVVAVDMNPNAIGFQEENIQREIISTIDIPKVLKCAEMNKIDGIMTLASDMPMRTIAEVSSKMGLVGITQESAYKATNKVAMRIALAEHNVPIPMFFKVGDFNEYCNAIETVTSKGFKCIVKPADNSGSRGVFLVNGNNSDYWKRIYDYSKQSSRSGDLIVEEYMEGAEVSVETLTVENKCHVIQVTDKLTTGAPYFVEMGHSQPSRFSDAILKNIKSVAIAANRAIGITNGPSHTEIKVTPQGAKIVELGARLGGDNITTHLVPFSTGVNMVKACIEIALGIKPEIKSSANCAAAIRYLDVGEGIVNSIDGIEDAKKTEFIKQVSILVNKGSIVSKIRNSNDRVGFVISQADSVDNAIKSCENAIAKIKIGLK